MSWVSHYKTEAMYADMIAGAREDEGDAAEAKFWRDAAVAYRALAEHWAGHPEMDADG